MENNLVENFLEFLQNDKKLSDNTLQSYNRDIKLYCNYLDQNNMDMVKTEEEDIKVEFFRHTCICLLIFFILVISSFIEVYMVEIGQNLVLNG